jgi:hypothetical protein
MEIFPSSPLASLDQRKKAESWKFISGRKCDVMRVKTLPLFELARALVRFDHAARVVVNADHSIM